MTAAVRDGDLVARLGGDEFAVLLQHINPPDTGATGNTRARRTNPPRAIARDDAIPRDDETGRAQALSRTEAAAVADRIQAHLAHPVSLAGHTLRVSASIGIATQPCAVTVDPEALLRAADTAMYQAKTTGGGRHAIYTPDPHPAPAPAATAWPAGVQKPSPSATSSQPPVRVSVGDVAPQ